MLTRIAAAVLVVISAHSLDEDDDAETGAGGGGSRGGGGDAAAARAVSPLGELERALGEELVRFQSCLLVVRLSAPRRDAVVSCLLVLLLN